MHVKLERFKVLTLAWCGSLENGMRAQVSTSLLDLRSKLRGPLPQTVLLRNAALINRWCNTAPASGPIREIILDKTKSPALGFLGKKSPNINGTHPDFGDREPIPELQDNNKKNRDSGHQPCPIPAPSLSQAKLSFDLLVVK
ncbi:hypothetical protein TNCV_595731 [Trichonephila clavipes]|nr:hypothetical protein TNCV_595731 [Trichonephila clavipes]